MDLQEHPAFRYTPRMPTLTKPVRYEVRRSPRARRIGLTVHPDGRVVITLPLRASLRSAERFALVNRSWIETKIKEFTVKGSCILVPGGRRDFLRYKERARMLIHLHVRRTNAVYRSPSGAFP